MDSALDALLAPDAAIEELGEGFTWAEGPVWVPAQGALLFSDVPENRVHRWKDLPYICKGCHCSAAGL